MSDQADELRQLVERGAITRRGGNKRAPTLVAVCGGKGGVGTTTVAINLACALIRDGRSTVLVDVAGEASDLATRCNLPQRESIQDVLAGRRSLHEVLLRGPGGLLILPGDPDGRHESRINEQTQMRLLGQLRDFGKFAEFVVLDVGRGAAHTAQQFCPVVDTNLIVTTPDDVSVMDTYAALKHLARQRRGELAGTIVNLADDAWQARDVHARLSLACRRFLGSHIHHAGHIPRAAQLSDVDSHGRPAASEYPEMPGLFGFEALAAQIVERACDASRDSTLAQAV